MNFAIWIDLFVFAGEREKVLEDMDTTDSESEAEESKQKDENEEKSGNEKSSKSGEGSSGGQGKHGFGKSIEGEGQFWDTNASKIRLVLHTFFVPMVVLSTQFTIWNSTLIENFSSFTGNGLLREMFNEN